MGPLKNLLKCMRENGEPKADGTVMISVDKISKCMGKRHGINKKLIQNSGGDCGLAWIQKHPSSPCYVQWSGESGPELPVRSVGSGALPTSLPTIAHLLNILDKKLMPLSEVHYRFYTKYGIGLFEYFKVNSLKALIKKYPESLLRIRDKVAKQMGYKEALLGPIFPYQKMPPKAVSAETKGNMKKSLSSIQPSIPRMEILQLDTVSFADVSNEDDPLVAVGAPVEYSFEEKYEEKCASDISIDYDQSDGDSSSTSEDDQSSAATLNEKVASLSLEPDTFPQNDKTIFNYFYQTELDSFQSLIDKNSVLLGESALRLMRQQVTPDCGLLGRISCLNPWFEDTCSTPDESIFLNVTQPFCLVCVGVQGAGKSHTMNTVLESCLIPCLLPSAQPITCLAQSMCGLVLHYDQSVNNVCEATGLRNINKQMDAQFRLSEQGVSGVKRMVILVSPTYYHQRKHFYRDQDFEVRPLLFKWSSLGAQQLKKLMRLSEKDTQLYVSVMLDLLRKYQRDGRIPVFEDFVTEVKNLCKVQGQSGPLDQRLQLLQSVIKESELNAGIVSEQVDLMDLMASGTLVVADLTDPLLSPDEANGIFQVLLEQFRTSHLPKGVGRVVAFDEAHKYLCGGQGGSEGGGKDGLSMAIINTVRLMRHEGIRVLISTQSPLALPHELLELVSVTVAHHFQSHDWYKFLSTKIPMPQDGFTTVKRLKVGEALVICTKMKYSHRTDDSCSSSEEAIQLRIRPRITANYGSSKTTHLLKG